MLGLLLGLFTPFLVAVTVLAPARQTVPFAAAHGQAQKEPLEYSQEMIPVFIHDRCRNCHGEVNPTETRNGGPIMAAARS